MKEAKSAAAAAVDSARSAEAASVASLNASTAAEASKADAQRVAATANDVSRTATEIAEAASGAAASATAAAQIAEALARQRSPQSPGRSVDDPAAMVSRVSELASAYNEARKSRRGGARTTGMTSIVADMISFFDGRDSDEVGLRKLLEDDTDRGRRLAAYAYLYANPKPSFSTTLAGQAIKEDKPFGEYWGLRALRRQLEIDRRSIDLNSVRMLRQRLLELQQTEPKSDRAHELRAIADLLSPASDWYEAGVGAPVTHADIGVGDVQATLS